MANKAPNPDSKKLVIRRATPSDAAQIHRLILDFADSLGTVERVSASAEDFARASQGEPPAFEALIAERGGAPIGLCVFLNSFSTWTGRRGIYIQDLYVAASARGLGLGRRLLAEAAAIAHARGGNYLRLSVDIDNEGAKAFYRRLGLHQSSDERIYQVRGQDFAELAARAQQPKSRTPS